MNIKFLIEEEIDKFILTESLSQKLFHFCDFNALYGIMRTNTFALTPASNTLEDKRMSTIGNHTYNYYMCFSRLMDAKAGYVRHRYLNTSSWRNCLCRLHIDGSRLNEKYKGTPVNYVNDDTINRGIFRVSKDDMSDEGFNNMLGGKNSLYNGKMASFRNDNGELNDISYNSKQENFEFEDRLVSDNAMIPNASRYITQIDILIGDNFFKYKGAKERLQRLENVIYNSNFINGNNIFIFNDFEAFNHPKAAINAGLAINDKFNVKKNELYQYKRLSKSKLYQLAAIIAIILEDECSLKSARKLAYGLMTKYGLVTYADEVSQQTKALMSKNTPLGTLFMCNKNLSMKGGNWSYQILMKTMLSDYLSQYNLPLDGLETFKRNLKRFRKTGECKTYEDEIRNGIESGAFERFCNMQVSQDVTNAIQAINNRDKDYMHKEDFSQEGIENKRIENSKNLGNGKLNQRIKTSDYYEPESNEYNFPLMRKIYGKGLLSNLRNNVLNRTNGKDIRNFD